MRMLPRTATAEAKAAMARKARMERMVLGLLAALSSGRIDDKVEEEEKRIDRWGLHPLPRNRARAETDVLRSAQHRDIELMLTVKLEQSNAAVVQSNGFERSLRAPRCPALLLQRGMRMRPSLELKRPERG